MVELAPTKGAELKNRNAVATLIATKLVEAVQAILTVYFHKTLPAFWQTELTSDFAVAVLYVGKDGIKGALVRVAALAKRVWSPAGANA